LGGIAGILQNRTILEIEYRAEECWRSRENRRASGVSRHSRFDGAALGASFAGAL